MIFDLEYASARVRVLRSKLLKNTIKQEIRDSKTKEELIANLDNTAYEAMFASKDIDEIEENFNNHLIQTLNKVTSFLPKRYAEDFSKYLARFDLRNLKLIIRGIHADMNLKDIKEDLTGYGEIQKMAEETDNLTFETLENRLENTQWHQAYKEGLTNYKKTRKVLDLEHPLDKAYMTQLEKIQTEPVKEFTKRYKRMIDIKTIARLKDRADSYLFLPDEKKETSDIAEKDTGTLETHTRKALLTDPFGIGLYIEFIFRKEMETLLIKSILRRVWK